MQILGYIWENMKFNSERFFILITLSTTFHFQMKNMLKLNYWTQYKGKWVKFKNSLFTAQLHDLMDYSDFYSRNTKPQVSSYVMEMYLKIEQMYLLSS